MQLFLSTLQRVSGCRKMSAHSVKCIKLNKVIDFLESFAPKSLAEKWDNTGLLLEPVTQVPVKSILVTNDLTEDVVEEAVGLHANLIISYHPPIFKPLKRITTTNWKERIIGTCLENKIAIYSPHTSWDSVPGGVNDYLAGAFDCATIKPIIVNNSGGESAGAGRFCQLKQEIKMSKAIDSVKKLICQPYLNVALARGTTLDNGIRDVAICAGSGSSVLDGVKADLYVTGEMSHHSLLDAIHNKTSVILCNHSNSERCFLHVFSKKLENEFAMMDLKVHVSKKDRDPIQFT